MAKLDGERFRLTRLRNTNNVGILEDRGQNIGLDRRRYFVSTQTYVVQHRWMKTSIFELGELGLALWGTSRDQPYVPSELAGLSVRSRK